MMPNSLERINPDLVAPGETTGSASLQLHLNRYRFAGENLVPGTVADIACGVGYGSYLLATEFGEKISGITAVDIDEESIRFAKSRYPHPNIQHVCADAMEWTPSMPWNNIVSLETIEHLPRPADFVNRLCHQLLPGGHFIASVPITPSMDANPYHMSDFSRKSFIQLFRNNGLRLLHQHLQRQPYQPFSLMSKKEKRTEQMRGNLAGYYLKHPDKFFLRLRSLLTDGFCNKYLVAVFEKPA